MRPSKASRKTPNFASLAEIARLAGKSVGEIRREISRRRIEDYGESFPFGLSSDEAAWLLCRSRSFVVDLVRRGVLLAEIVPGGEWARYQLARDEVIASAKNENGKEKL